MEEEPGMEKYSRAKETEAAQDPGWNKVRYFFTMINFLIQGMQDSGCDDVDDVFIADPGRRIFRQGKAALLAGKY